MLRHLLQSYFKTKQIEVEIDSILATELSNHSSSYSACGNQIVSFSLFDLISSVGTIQTRIEKPSLRSKFDVNSDLFAWLENGQDFRIKVALNDAEAKKRVSEDFGIGLAAVITDKLFGIKTNTLAKINSYGKRPDFQCSTSLNKFMVIEGKGTFSSSKRSIQISNALIQKTTKRADIKIASSSLLKTNMISNVKYVDPPIIPPDDPEYLKRLLMAYHYSQAFNYIGQKELSRYFSLMAERIMHDREFPEYNTKEKLFEDIKRDYLKISINDFTFLGRLDLLDDGKYVFSGFDERLLWVAGFLDFEEYDNTLSFSNEENIFNVSKDGICLGLIENLNSLPLHIKLAINDQILKGRVKHYQDYTTIEDIDVMGQLSFYEYFEYLLKEIGFRISRNSGLRERHGSDFYLEYEGKQIIIEIKKTSRYFSLSAIETFAKRANGYKKLLITNGRINRLTREFIQNNNIIVVDRSMLIEIINNRHLLIEILERI